MRQHIRRCLPAAWLRLQETPLELTISFLAAVVGVVQLAYEWDTLSWTGVATDVVLVVGGLSAVAGRFADDPDAESAGLAFLIAGFLFIFLQQFGGSWALGVEAMLGLVSNFGALIAGYGIRLRVVRVAARARRRAARGGHGAG